MVTGGPVPQSWTATQKFQGSSHIWCWDFFSTTQKKALKQILVCWSQGAYWDLHVNWVIRAKTKQ